MILFPGSAACRFSAIFARPTERISIYSEPGSANLTKKIQLQNHLFRLEGKTAIVTGSGSGIGKAVALLFARQGAAMHLLDLNEDAVNATAREIAEEKGQAIPQPCDVTNAAQVREVFRRIGRVDILVNSAGVSHIGTVETTVEADFDRLYQVNVKGVYHCLQAAIGLMKLQGSGAILNLASIANQVGLPDRFAYSM